MNGNSQNDQGVQGAPNIQNRQGTQYTQETLQYLLLTQDPVHVGTGGYRLGRADQTVVREPATGLPKIPGTSLSGRLRSVLAHLIRQPQCAGHGGGNSHCGQCPVCYTFGWLNNKGSQAGVAHVADARLLLFPMASWAGPVWITTSELLKEYGFTVSAEPGSEHKVLLGEKLKALGGRFGLGWVVLEVEDTSPSLEAPVKWRRPELLATLKRTVLVHPSIFAHMVNSGMEVRTSVSIDPETGAAKKGLLFTYEAIPRGAWYALDVVIDDYLGSFPKKYGEPWSSARATLEEGLKKLELVGVGGLGTRGFGRVRWVRASDAQQEEGAS